MTFNSRSWLGAMAAAAILTSANLALASDLVVVEARGVDLKPGQTINGTQRLKLDAGARVTLIAPNGTSIKLRGPYEDAPAPASAGDDGRVGESLRRLVSQRQADASSLGVIRAAGGPKKDLPEPWLIDVSQPGNRCLIEGSQAVFWRPDRPAAAQKIEIAPADRSWQARADWPTNSEKLAMPKTMPISDGATFMIELAGATSAVTIHLLPAAIGSDTVRAAWMLEKGCDQQAAALAKTLQ